jgi:hypothetical protein
MENGLNSSTTITILTKDEINYNVGRINIKEARGSVVG